MSLSLAKKNIKHKRKTMKRKHGGGIRLFGTRKDPLNSTRGNAIDRSMSYISSSIGSIIPGKKKTNTDPGLNSEEVGKAMITYRVQKKSNAAYSDSDSASALVATLAAANQQTCATTYESIKKQLEDKNIKSISKKETKRLTNMGTVTFDNRASQLETSEAFIKMVKNISFAMEAAKSALPPGTTGIIGIAESLGVAASKYNKQLELVYLSAQCLIYVSNISHDLAEIHSFYNNENVKAKDDITIDQSLYESLVKSIFTFTYFLIDNIDFESKISGIDQFKFWYSFLSRIDFSQTKKGYIYKYSCKECIPKELREKLQFISIYDTNYEKIINFDYVFDTSNPDTKKKSRLARLGARLGLDRITSGESVLSSTASRAGRVLSSTASKAGRVLSSTASKAGRKMGIASKGLFGFCSDEIVAQCKNYNDIIMRLIEFNIYKLFRNTYRNQNNLPINFERTSSGITSKVFYEYIFEDKYIDAIKANTDDNAVAVNNIDRSNLSDDELQTLVKKWLINYKYISEEVLEERLCLEFLFELKRIIVDLRAGTMLDTYKQYFKIETEYRGKSLVESGKFLVSLSSAYLGDVRVKYDIFLREYVIMTGNFATILSRYSLDYNKLTQKDKDIIRGEVTKDMQPIEDKLIIIENNIQQAAIGGIENAKTEAEAIEQAEKLAEKLATEGAEGAPGLEEREESQGGGKITHNRLKKHSKKYKIYKKYKHSKKIKNKRKQKQY